MLKSLWLFAKGIIKRTYFWFGLLFFGYGFFDVFIKPNLPIAFQRLPDMPIHIGFILFAILMFLACWSSYHKLRMHRLSEFYKFSPEANGDRIFRIFYTLYREGEFLKDSNVKRRQEWDEKVLKTIKEFCEQEFEHIYLLNTGRRNYDFTPLEDTNYDTALSHLKDLIDRDFNLFVRV